MIYYVNANASRDGNGSEEMPFRRINDAARIAVGGLQHPFLQADQSVDQLEDRTRFIYVADQWISPHFVQVI